MGMTQVEYQKAIKEFVDMASKEVQRLKLRPEMQDEVAKVLQDVGQKFAKKRGTVCVKAQDATLVFLEHTDDGNSRYLKASAFEDPNTSIIETVIPPAGWSLFDNIILG